jgi:hypothetical protein
VFEWSQLKDVQDIGLLSLSLKPSCLPPYVTCDEIKIEDGVPAGGQNSFERNDQQGQRAHVLESASNDATREYAGTHQTRLSGPAQLVAA